MSGDTQELLDAARGVLPLLEASTDHRDAVKKAEGMPISVTTQPTLSSILSARSLILVEPSELDDVISLTPATRPRKRSSGVATDDAIVSGLAPGNEADT